MGQPKEDTAGVPGREGIEAWAGRGAPEAIAASRAPRALVDHLFRHQHGRIVASLTRSLGPQHLDLALDAVQEACLSALLSWPYDGLPAEPDAWLCRVARNKAIDRIRRSRKQSDDPQELEQRCKELLTPAETSPEEEIDDHLRLIFTCCHPELPRGARVALTLKTVCGFSVAEIARAFFATDAALAQRLVRAKHTIRDRRVAYQVPEGAELLPRLDSVHQVLLLLFNEGYSSLGGEHSVRVDMMEEALRLVGLLTRDPRTATPATDALEALFCFQSSRNPARLDSEGAMIPLPDQDRTRWDRGLLDAGLLALARSARGEVETRYHILAEIGSAHALAPRFEDTDWERICAAYRRLLRREGSRAGFLGLVVAESYLHGAQSALLRLDARGAPAAGSKEPNREAAVRADLLFRLGRLEEARVTYRSAAALARNPAERRYLERRAST